MKNAFTLIELLVVVLIIGILAAVALPQYEKSVEKSRLTEAISFMRSLQNSMSLYVLENGYPQAKTTLRGTNILTLDAPAVTQYFMYDAYCGDSYCEVMADRRGNTSTPILYRLQYRKYANSSEYKGCSPRNNSEIGTKICALLRNEGWN